MTFTFDADLATNTDLVRARIGDTLSTDYIVEDETIEAYLDVYNDNVLRTAIQCCRFVLGRLARDVDDNMGGSSRSRSQKTQHYRDVLKDLEAEFGLQAQPEVGGISIAENEAAEANTDANLIPFGFGRDSYT